MKKIFISYSDLDRNKMNALKRAIEKVDSELKAVVIADEKKPLRTLAEKVEEGIRQSNILVPILTSNSINNQWVNQEIGFAKAHGIEIIPIIDDKVLKKLKGFVHSQVDCPFLYTSDKNPNKESAAFRKAYSALLSFLKPNSSQYFKSHLSTNVIRQGEAYTTFVEFKGFLNNGFFDNYVQHLSSDFYRWNVDRETLPRGKNTDPGTLSGAVEIKKSYVNSTSDWPKGKYRIDVRLYDHLKAGETGRPLIAEESHSVEVI
jgi:hypothetical protein